MTTANHRSETDTSFAASGSLGDAYGARLMVGFGGVVFAVILAVLVGGWFSFYGLVEDNQKRLAGSLAQTISNSVLRVSFSGKHHAQLLIDEFVAKDSMLSYIVIQTEDDPQFADAGNVPESVRVLAVPKEGQRGTVDEPIVRTFDFDGEPIQELVVPFRAGYGEPEVGVVRIGLSQASTVAVFDRGLWFLVLGGLILFCVSMGLVFYVSRRLSAPVQRLAAEFRGILDHAPISICIQDAEGRVVRTSRTYLECFELSQADLASHSVYDFLGEEERERARREDVQVLSGEREITRGERLLRVGERERMLVYSKFILRGAHDQNTGLLCTIALDVTDQRELEACLNQARSMESIGQFAGGVAHDFNNMLTGISGCAELLELVADQPESVNEYALEIQALCRRASELTRRLLTFGRKQVMVQTHHDLALVVPEMRSFLIRLLRDDIELLIDSDSAEHLHVEIDRGQFEQVLMNLVANARDAMKGGGTVRLGLDRVEVDEARVVGVTELKPGRYAVLRVEDNGQGIPEHVRGRLFDPFATTKGIGEGTGLGLSLVFSIVTQHGGAIGFDSTVGVGTTFYVYLPLVGSPESTMDSDARPSLAVEPQPARILIAEDDDQLRRNAQTALEQRGYLIEVAVDGRDAIDFYRREEGRFDLVLLDVIMPRANGGEVFSAIRDLDGEMPVLFMTGYDEGMLVELLREHRHLDFITKPFRFDELEKKIEALLNLRVTSRP